MNIHSDNSDNMSTQTPATNMQLNTGVCVWVCVGRIKDQKHVQIQMSQRFSVSDA